MSTLTQQMEDVLVEHASSHQVPGRTICVCGVTTSTAPFWTGDLNWPESAHVRHLAQVLSEL